MGGLEVTTLVGCTCEVSGSELLTKACTRRFEEEADPFARRWPSAPLYPAVISNSPESLCLRLGIPYAQIRQNGFRLTVSG